MARVRLISHTARQDGADGRGGAILVWGVEMEEWPSPDAVPGW